MPSIWMIIFILIAFRVKNFLMKHHMHRSGTSLNKDDWRRSNVDSIIEAINICYQERKETMCALVFPLLVFGEIKIKTRKGSDTPCRTNQL